MKGILSKIEKHKNFKRRQAQTPTQNTEAPTLKYTTNTVDSNLTKHDRFYSITKPICELSGHPHRLVITFPCYQSEL